MRRAVSVVDHDNAGEERSVETLNGGETFRVSPALALQLSEQVQTAAGALRLDGIFIDEGFGTLDPSMLGVVADALQSLPVNGRMVGVITHVAELPGRLPGRIKVERGPDGPRAVVES
ncbi:MAG TPA: SbcC/MukB-like Walker B domain-containing protein [Myxococcaceae bacterium]|nr:SbcC/MukB-like Walker B domain-containing protein [Myxococcaceae bacterium]